MKTDSRIASAADAPSPSAAGSASPTTSPSAPDTRPPGDDPGAPGDFITPETIHQAVGRTFASDWIRVDQERISEFGRITEDPDPHHIDPEYAARHSPWGRTISFGFLTMSLMTPMLYQIYRYPMDGKEGDGYPASYGFERVRLVAPVLSGSRIRGHFTVKEVRERKPGQLLAVFGCRVEIKGEERPALVGDWLSLWLKP